MGPFPTRDVIRELIKVQAEIFRVLDNLDEGYRARVLLGLAWLWCGGAPASRSAVISAPHARGPVLVPPMAAPGGDGPTAGASPSGRAPTRPGSTRAGR